MELDFASCDNAYLEYEDKFVKITNITLKHLKYTFEPIISVALVNNEFIHELNKTYRHIDKETDVISFAFIDVEKDKDKIFLSKSPYVLGDIYISIEKAIAQAQEIGNTLNREILFLFVHGLLHLLGFDHTKNVAEEKIMFSLQEIILEKYLKEMGENK